MTKITWLGQAGLLFEFDGLTVMVDPYLSDSVKSLNPEGCRRVPVDEAFFDIKPDVLVFTHDHIDHYDPETVKRFITADSGITVLSPRSVWEKVRLFGGNNNYVCFNRRSSWTEKEVIFTAVKAEHSDPYAIGVVMDTGKYRYYVTGDTLYNEDIFSDLPRDIYALFLPVNGVGNNMNAFDAERFACRVSPQKAVPIHIGLLDNKTADIFNYENKVVPQIYKEIKL
ncbi:MAG: MBL fold metallo-hydrolase [Clostridia bacterium]|nr:MBL fold metallo-hydrolase [Clostridia bacterium]